MVTSSSVQSGTLAAATKRSFLVEIFKILRKQAEDLLLSNSADKGSSLFIAWRRNGVTLDRLNKVI